MAKVITRGKTFGSLACAIDIFGWQAILVHPCFHTLPARFQLAILAHEEGHLVRHHIKIRWGWALIGRWWWDAKGLTAAMLAQEMQADAYAAGLGFGEALLTVLLQCKNEAHKVPPQSVARIDRLRTLLNGSVCGV